MTRLGIWVRKKHSRYVALVKFEEITRIAQLQMELPIYDLPKSMEGTGWQKKEVA